MTTMSDETCRFVTGSRRRDVRLLVFLAAAIVATSSRLIVYSDALKLLNDDLSTALGLYKSNVRFRWKLSLLASVLTACLLAKVSRPGARLDRFLFAPVDPLVVSRFRVAFAAALAVMMWPERRFLAPPLARYKILRRLWYRYFLTPPLWFLALAVLVAWGSGFPDRGRRRWTGWLSLALLLPRAFLAGVMPSRHVLLSSLLSFSLLRADWFGARDFDCATAGPMWPVRLVQLQLSVLYLVNAIAKSKMEYLSGNVLVVLSGRSNFLVDLSGGTLELWNLSIPVWLCAWGTVAVEYALGLMFWHPRLRWPAVVLGVSFHMGLKLVVMIGWLDWACIFLYLAFLLPFERHTHPSSEGGDTAGLEGGSGVKRVSLPLWNRRRHQGVGMVFGKNLRSSNDEARDTPPT